jgi:hypothetical protein
MIRLLLLVSALTIVSCATKKTTSGPAKAVEVNEDFYQAHTSESKGIDTTEFQLKLVTEALDNQPMLIGDIESRLIGKNFLSSQIFPEGSLFRKRIHTFSKDERKQVIEATLVKDEKYSSYKLVIPKKNPKNKKDMDRQWLYPDTLSSEQLAIRIAKTIIRYSFQEL